MRASATLKSIMAKKEVSIQELAERTGKSPTTIYATFANDKKSKGGGMAFENVVKFAEALGCEVVIRDKETGHIF